MKLNNICLITAVVGANLDIASAEYSRKRVVRATASEFGRVSSTDEEGGDFSSEGWQRELGMSMSFSMSMSYDFFDYTTMAPTAPPADSSVPAPPTDSSAPTISSPLSPTLANEPTGTSAPTPTADSTTNNSNDSPVVCGDSDSYGITNGLDTTDVTITLAVEADGSGLGFTDDLEDAVLQTAAGALGLCTTSGRRLTHLARRLEALGVELNGDASLSSTETCTPEAPGATNCHVVDVPLRFHLEDSSKADEVEYRTAHAIKESLEDNSFFAEGYPEGVVDVNLFNAAAAEETASQGEMDRAIVPLQDNNSGAKKIVILAVLCVSLAAVVGVIAHRKLKKDKKGKEEFGSIGTAQDSFEHHGQSVNGGISSSDMETIRV